MTEAEWLAGSTPEELLDIVEGLGEDSIRKDRLLLAGCCRRVVSLMTHPHSRRAVEMVELAADESVSEEECGKALERARQLVGRRRIPKTAAFSAARAAACGIESLREAACAAATAAGRASASPGGFQQEQQAQVALIRDIYGNPFRPVAADPSWRTSTVDSLARQMYESRDFSPMPILADALQDAGCENPDVLDHCRGPGPHARGCWVVDLLLGKE